MKMRFYVAVSGLILMTFLMQPSVAFGQKKDDNPLRNLDNYVQSTMKDWNVPAVSLAIVKDGKVLLTKGYGYADVDKKQKADEKTLFAIGSSSKAFTAASVMQLVDRGKLDLDKPVVHYLPDFKLFDDYTTQHITTRDLLCHRSGLPRHDLSWYGSMASREDLYKRLQYLEPTKALRETWQYQNLMYMTAGYLVGELERETWEENVQRKILNPLGMTSTNFSVEISKKNPNHALPYGEKDGKVDAVPFRNLDAVAPAGAINSNAEDMAKWLQLLLNEGKFDGETILSTESMTELYQPQMVMPGSISDEVFYTSYGLGWMLSAYRGKLRVEHGGNIDGFSASVCFLPRDGIGVVVLTNMNATMLPSIIRNHVIDLLLEGEQKDWNAYLLEKRNEALNASKVTETKEDIVQRKNTKPSFQLDEYVGKYQNLGYDVIEIIEKDGQLFALMNGSEQALAHYHFDVFKATTLVGDLKLQFQMNFNGEITALEIPIEPSLKALTFKKLPPEVTAAAVNSWSLYEGKYVFKQAGQTVTVAVENDVLTVTLPGQPTYTLLPYKQHHFNIKTLEGFSLKFTVENGKATQATFIQPNGNFTFEKE